MSDYPWRPQPETKESPGARLEEIGQRASETARLAQEHTRHLSDDLERGVERLRTMTAAGLSWAANTLRTSSTSPDATARRLADNLERSATYLRETDLAGMQRDLGTLVRQYPVQAMGAAFAVGWVLGRRFGRR